MFERALEIVIKHETGGDLSGALHAHPSDPGGVTKWGIAQRYHPDVDVKKLTRADAAGIYHREYWAACRCDELPWPIALYLFDCAVNPGAATARRMLQQALDVAIDGVIGPLTLAAAHRANAKQLVIELHVLRNSYWRSRQNYVTFKDGWTARAAGTLWECAKG